jgi:hypothetical protein
VLRLARASGDWLSTVNITKPIFIARECGVVRGGARWRAMVSSIVGRLLKPKYLSAARSYASPSLSTGFRHDTSACVVVSMAIRSAGFVDALYGLVLKVK